MEPGAPPTTLCVSCRRYECQACGAVLTVVPRGVARRRHFSAGAIGLALALFGLAGQDAVTVRRQITPWQTASAAGWPGWITLRRWITAVRRRTLFARVRVVSADGATARGVAERVAMALAANAPPHFAGTALASQAFHGATFMA